MLSAEAHCFTYFGVRLKRLKRKSISPSTNMMTVLSPTTSMDYCVGFRGMLEVVDLSFSLPSNGKSTLNQRSASSERLRYCPKRPKKEGDKLRRIRQILSTCLEYIITNGISFALASTVTLLVSVLAAQAQSADPPKPFTGKVVSIADGDTITVLLDKTQHKIRLDGIDAPESSQAFGTKAKKILGDKVFGQEVKIEWKERDKYKRIIGEVYLGDRRICLEMVAEGYAWHYKRFSNDADLARGEREARDGRKGLWADPNPVPPWDYRKKK